MLTVQLPRARRSRPVHVFVPITMAALPLATVVTCRACAPVFESSKLFEADVVPTVWLPNAQVVRSIDRAGPTEDVTQPMSLNRARVSGPG